MTRFSKQSKRSSGKESGSQPGWLHPDKKAAECDVPPYIERKKGVKSGFCNRKGCLSPVDVVWFNSSTQKYYCPKCAEIINYWSNLDAGLIICKEESGGY